MEKQLLSAMLQISQTQNNPLFLVHIKSFLPESFFQDFNWKIDEKLLINSYFILICLKFYN